MPIGKPCRKSVIFIVGPTAIGKTRIAVKLAQSMKGEIISCDSMQVYKGMRILSQQPLRAQQKRALHHLVSVLDPRNEYSVASFRRRAYPIIDSLIKHNKIPIIAGGSGLYVKALVDGLFPSPKADIRFRREMERYAARYGRKKLHRKLSKIDPVSASNIHPNDIRRVIRALEIYKLTASTMTELKGRTKGLKDIYPVKIFGLIRAREDIYKDIDLRVEAMFREGVVGEVRKLVRKKLSKTARGALGLKEIKAYLTGEYDLDRLKCLIKKNTRHFAKRQLTWFRRDKRVKWLNLDRLDDNDVVRRIKKEAC